MEDNALLDLLFERSEAAVEAFGVKFRGVCKRIALNILHTPEDAEECWNDVLFQIWSSIPPDRPDDLTAYTCKIARNIALDRYRRQHRQKRFNGGGTDVPQELMDVAGGRDLADHVALADVLNRFLDELSPRQRTIFLRRYWFFDPIRDIACLMGESEGAIKAVLHRARKKLARRLSEGGV